MQKPDANLAARVMQPPSELKDAVLSPFRDQARAVQRAPDEPPRRLVHAGKRRGVLRSEPVFLSVGNQCARAQLLHAADVRVLVHVEHVLPRGGLRFDRFHAVPEGAEKIEHHVGADGAERMLVAERIPPVRRSVDHRGHGFSGGHRTSNPARRRSSASSLVSIEPMRRTVRTESGPSGYVRIEWTFKSRWLTKLVSLASSPG